MINTNLSLGCNHQIHTRFWCGSTPFSGVITKLLLPRRSDTVDRWYFAQPPLLLFSSNASSFQRRVLPRGSQSRKTFSSSNCRKFFCMPPSNARGTIQLNRPLDLLVHVALHSPRLTTLESPVGRIFCVLSGRAGGG